MSDKLPEGTSAKASGAKPAATATAKAGAPAEATPDTTATATDLTPESLAQALDLASDWDNPCATPATAVYRRSPGRPVWSSSVSPATWRARS